MAEPQSTVVAPLIADARRLERAKALAFTMDFVDRSDEYRQPFMHTWDELLDNYMVVPYQSGARHLESIGQIGNYNRQMRGGMFGRAQLKDPETHQIVETLTSQAMGLLFSGRDYIQATPIGSDDVDKARMLSKLLMAILEQPGQFRTHYQLFKTTFLLGTAYLEIGWETRSRKQLVKTPTIIDGIPVGEHLAPDEVVYRDAPLIREVDPWKFYPDPSGTRIQQDMQGVCKGFRITRQQVKEMSNGVYDRVGVDEALESKPDNMSEDTKSQLDDRFPSVNRQSGPGFGMMDGYEYWGRVPFPTADGASNRVITVINGAVVRNRINPFIDGMIPFKEVVVNPIGGRHYGLAPAEVIRYLQDTTDGMLMNFTDASNAAVRGALLVGRGLGGSLDRIKERRLLDLIPVNDPDKVKPVPVDLGAMQFAMQNMIQRKLTMRESVGAVDPLNRDTVGDRATATHISEVVRLASTKTEAMTTLIERDDYPWIGKTIHSRLRQFGSESGFISTLAGEQVNVPFEAIDFEADVRFSGSRQATSKFQRAASFREAMQILANPQIVAMYPGLVIRHLRDNLDIPDAEQQVAQALQVAQQLIQAQQQSGAGGANNDQRRQTSPSQSETFGTQTGQTEQQGQRVA